MTFFISARTATRNSARRRRRARPASARAGACADGVHAYFDSLWTWCLLQRGQYFFHSTRSGCFRLFLSVK